MRPEKLEKVLEKFVLGNPVTGFPDGTAPNVLNTSYTITANIDVPQGGAEGVILTEGGQFGGYGLYLLKGKRHSPGICSILSG